VYLIVMTRTVENDLAPPSAPNEGRVDFNVLHRLTDNATSGIDGQFE
jgi:hypothetical protein